MLCEEAKEGRDEVSEPSVLQKTALLQGQNVYNIVAAKLFFKLATMKRTLTLHRRHYNTEDLESY